MDEQRIQNSTASEAPEVTEVSGAITQSESTPEDSLVAVSTEASKAAAEAALAGIRLRASFSARNPQLGKMINCPFCGLRHRQHGFRQQGMTCGQVFVKKNGVEQIAGQTKATEFDRTVEADIPRKAFRIQFGTAGLRNRFGGKRMNPHNNKRQLQYIRIVRNNLPDLYTQEDLKQARNIAATSMGLNRKKTYGKYVKEVKNVINN